MNWTKRGKKCSKKRKQNVEVLGQGLLMPAVGRELTDSLAVDNAKELRTLKYWGRLGKPWKVSRSLQREQNLGMKLPPNHREH